LRENGSLEGEVTGQRAGGVNAADEDFAVSGMKVSREKIEERGLAGSVGPYDGEKLSRFDLEVDIGDERGALHSISDGGGDDGVFRCHAA
jgi:hypothetical protein